MMSKYFNIKKERRALVQQMMQAIYDRLGRFLQLEQTYEYLKCSISL